MGLACDRSMSLNLIFIYRFQKEMVQLAMWGSIRNIALCHYAIRDF